MGDPVMDVYGALRAAGVSDRQARSATSTINRQADRIAAMESEIRLLRGLLVANMLVTLGLVAAYLVRIS